MDVGAYDIPTFEWGTASSPIIWNDLVILQVDTQADSFLIALKAETGETVWKTDREELPVVGHTDGRDDRRRTGAGDERVELHPRLRPEHRQGAVEARRQLEDHRADAAVRGRAVRRVERPRAGAPDLRDPSRWVGGVEQDRPRTLHADADHLPGAALRPRQQRRLRRLRSQDRRRRSTASGSKRSAMASAPRRSPPTARSISRTRTATSSSSPPGASSSRSA